MGEIILTIPEPIKAITPPPCIERTIIFGERKEDDNTQDEHGT